MSPLTRFNAAITNDRRFATWFYGVLAVLWALLGIGEGGGFQLGLRIFVVVCFAFVATTNAIAWRRDGRWRKTTSVIATPPSPELRTEVEQLVDEGKQIAAIKLVREQTGASLLEAKQTVEKLTEARRR